MWCTSQKHVDHQVCRNFAKYWPIFEILSQFHRYTLSKIRSELIIEHNTSETRYYIVLYNINERFLNVAH